MTANKQKLICFILNNSNQMETMVAWMVGNISPTNQTGEGWKHGQHDTQKHIFHEGHVELNSMPTMLLSEWLQIIGTD